MRNIWIIGLDFIIDKLTKSIEEASTGKSESTVILPIKLADFYGLVWQFDWILELKEENRQIFKLVTLRNLNLI